MHASFLVALALGGTAVSAACDPYCNFAASYDCSQNGGHHFTKDQMISILVNADRSGAPYEVWADNLATTYCSGVEYGDMPLWTVSCSLKETSVALTLNRYTDSDVCRWGFQTEQALFSMLWLVTELFTFAAASQEQRHQAGPTHATRTQQTDTTLSMLSLRTKVEFKIALYI